MQPDLVKMVRNLSAEGKQTSKGTPFTQGQVSRMLSTDTKKGRSN
jgi:hypothetical protein